MTLNLRRGVRARERHGASAARRAATRSSSAIPSTDAAQKRRAPSEIVATLAREAFRGAFDATTICRGSCGCTSEGAANGGFEEGVEVRALGRARASEVPVSLRADAGRSRPRAPRIALGERRARVAARRSSCGARSPMPSCSSWPRPTARGSRRARAAGRSACSPTRASETLASNFAYQWLGLGKLDSLAPDPVRVRRRRPRHPRRTSSRRRGCSSTASSARIASVLELLTADHTFVNEALARHYGINDVRGKRFRRVELADETRFGLARQGRRADGVVVSEPHVAGVARRNGCSRTLLGTPPAAAAAERRGARRERRRASRRATVRERLEAHRANPSCNGCHGVMDPLGFALENFDAVGRWRDHGSRSTARRSTRRACSSTARPSTGPSSCAQALLARPDQFVANVDRETDDLRARARARATRTCRRFGASCAKRRRTTTGFRPSCWGIVNSTQFRMKGGRAIPKLRAGGAKYSRAKENEPCSSPRSTATRRSCEGSARRVAAAARRDDPGRHRARANRRRAEAEARLLLFPARRGHGSLDADRRRAALSSCRRSWRRSKAFKNQMTVVSGLRNQAAEGAGVHAVNPGTWLACKSPFWENDRQTRCAASSADQIAAREHRRRTRRSRRSSCASKRSAAQRRGVQSRVRLRLGLDDLVPQLRRSRCRWSTTRASSSTGCSARATRPRSARRSSRRRAACSTS